LNLDNVKLFCGVDASFSGTGVIIIDNDCKIIDQKLISTKKKDDIYDIEKRMLFIVNDLSIFLTKYFKDLKLILIEGLSYGSTGDGAAQLAALNYFIRIFLLQNALYYDDVSPSKLKMFASGKGQSKKNLMLKEVYKRWGIDFDDDNLCDAYCLARLAHTNYNKMDFIK
jgi:crossover junction endodeoxyribonuclease RuvC